jgi:hypothetical protein
MDQPNRHGSKRMEKKRMKGQLPIFHFLYHENLKSQRALGHWRGTQRRAGQSQARWTE